MDERNAPLHGLELPFDEQTRELMYLSPPDELANVATHATGSLLSLGAGAWLWLLTYNSEMGLRVACMLFAASMFTVYAFSTLSHAVHAPLARHRMRAWDQGCIFLLIAGTYSPFIWAGSEGWVRLGLLAAVWLAAAAGFWMKVVSSHQIIGVSSVHYLLLGWLPALPLVSSTPGLCLRWMLIGGVSYTLGLIFWAISDRILFSHAMWHLMVMLGTASHLYAVMCLLTAGAG
jgi:hemolysin III